MQSSCMTFIWAGDKGVNKMTNEKLNCPCMDCGRETMEHGNSFDDYYIVRNDVWNSVVKETKRAFLCLDCLETRLGRKLTKADFPDLPINDMNQKVQTRYFKE